MNLSPSNQLRLFGHHNVLQKFVNLYLAKKLPNKILLSGEKGIGKSTLVNILVNFIFRVFIFLIYCPLCESP